MICAQVLFAQKQTNPLNHCAAATRLQDKLERSAAFRQRFEQREKEFARLMEDVKRNPGRQRLVGGVYYIPVVYHVLLQNPASVSDAQLQAQIDTLNKSFAGINDKTGLVAAFSPLAGGAKIQFCLARESPDGLPATGVVRYPVSVASYDPNKDDMKETALGGADPWNTNRYLNIWVCELDRNILGFASFPNGDDSAHQGIVIDRGTLPSVAPGSYNQGKTLVHEMGHFFNLIHIWGDDDGACTGSDQIDDTPNQANATYGSNTGIKTDACSPNAPGYMYQNFMDYSDDVSLLLFTNDQVLRMETTLSIYRLALGNSDACQPPQTLNLDLELLPNTSTERLCQASLVPIITIRNRGAETITSAKFRYRAGGTNWQEYTYTGSLATAQTASIPVNQVTAPTGQFTIDVEILAVNGIADENTANDAVSYPYQYYPAVAGTYKEDFENPAFPPAGWDIVNPDQGIGWEQYSGPSFSGTKAAMIRNFEYERTGSSDLLRLPQLNMTGIDSSFLSFQLASATYSSTTGSNTVWDTLEVVVSRDCGQTYNTVYKKWGESLRTVEQPLTSAFEPSGAGDWRKDSVNLSDYIGEENLLVAFRNTTGFENNLYLDDIQVRQVTVNPNLKAQGILVTPNPTTGKFTVQFYPQPTRLRAIQLYDMRGAKLQQVSIGAQGIVNRYDFDLGNQPAGIYLVRIVYEDKVIVKRILKSGN